MATVIPSPEDELPRHGSHEVTSRHDDSVRDVTNTSASGDQIKDSLPRLDLITLSADAVLLLGQQHGSPVIRLHKTQGSPLSDLLSRFEGGFQ